MFDSFETFEPLLSPEEAAEALGIGMNSIYSLLNEQKIAAFRIGKKWRIPRKSLSEFVIRESRKKLAGWK